MFVFLAQVHWLGLRIGVALLTLLMKLLGVTLKTLVTVGVWLLKMPVKTFAGFLAASGLFAWEELRRWTGVIMAGLIILVVDAAILKLFRDRPMFLLAALLLALAWLLAVVKSAQLTMRNRLTAVRQRQAFRRLSGQVNKLPTRGELVENVAKKTKGTPAESVFRTNREAKAREQERKQENAERSAAVAEQERLAREERERYLDELTATQHDPFQGRP